MLSCLQYRQWYKISVLLFVAAFSSLVEGKNEEMSTTELSGGARIHYIFQSIFVKSLEVHTMPDTQVF